MAQVKVSKEEGVTIPEEQNSPCWLKKCWQAVKYIKWRLHIEKLLTE